MYTTLASSTNYAIPFLIISVPFGVTSLLFIPKQLRERRLRKSGVETLAVCEERIRRGGTAVEMLNCSFRTTDGDEAWALVRTPRPVPQVGDEFPVVFDRRNPSTVESQYHLSSSGSRVGYVIQSLFGLLLVAAAVAGSLS
ncbi:hypothetical protein [Streptomyces aurantiogriseus]|uniref:DUF3592 domain-containing protein n=1 Tax=Streptomyces aurantiogriseus TaxID=66870 RepID=A0A918BZ94_9ACTN|nr:hypothetical protein [Streptomyces aurantiogriseus]GGQ99548.1 hypothetical protein GCM10010251_13370 [Streptomyces aurantiogriseus]